MPLIDKQIRNLALGGMITPFFDYDDEKTSISRGLSSSGYDLTLDEVIKVENPHLPENSVIDPLNSQEEQWVVLPVLQDINPKTKKIVKCVYVPPKTFFMCN